MNSPPLFLGLRGRAAIAACVVLATFFCALFVGGTPSAAPAPASDGWIAPADSTHPWTAIDPTADHWNANTATTVVRTTARLEPGERVTISRGSLTLELRSSKPVDEQRLASDPPPPGTFHAEWMSHGVRIVVDVVQRSNEPDGPFADRCKNKVLIFAASFPRDAQGATQSSGPDWSASGTVTRGGSATNAGGADGLGAHDWSANWDTHEDWNGQPGVASIVLAADEYAGEADPAFAGRCAAKLAAFLPRFPQS